MHFTLGGDQYERESLRLVRIDLHRFRKSNHNSVGSLLTIGAVMAR
jgi:hypothetical protein